MTSIQPKPKTAFYSEPNGQFEPLAAEPLQADFMALEYSPLHSADSAQPFHLKCSFPMMRSIHAPILFIVHDTGETKELLPVMDQLAKSGQPYKILAFGTARELMAASPHAPFTLDPARFGLSPIPETPDAVAAALQRLSSRLQADQVVTGSASEIQFQITDALQKTGARVKVLYDGYEPKSVEDDLRKRFLGLADENWVFSLNMSASVHSQSPRGEVRIVGAPTVASWRQAADGQNIAELRARMGLKTDKPVILYAGGYEKPGNEYREGLQKFLDSVKSLNNYEVVISLHPSELATGDLERELSQGMENVRVIKKTIPTQLAAVTADYIVSHRSTVGVQASCMEGKKVIYVDLPQPAKPYTNDAIRSGSARQVTSADQFRELIKKDSSGEPAGNFCMQLGMPKDPVGFIVENLKADLKKK